MTSTRSARRSPASAGTSVRSPAMSVSTRRRRARPEPARSYSPTAIRCGRSTGWLAGACWTTANAVNRSSASVWYSGRSVFTPAVSSHSFDQDDRSRPEAVSSAASRSARVALPQACSAEVGAYAGQEVVPADVGDELLEHRRALGVGDAVEVDLDGFDVRCVGGDRVGRGQLVLPVRPCLPHLREGGPGVRPAGGLGLRHVARPGGEGLVQPQVVPPAHGDQGRRTTCAPSRAGSSRPGSPWPSRSPGTGRCSPPGTSRSPRSPSRRPCTRARTAGRTCRTGTARRTSRGRSRSPAW